MADDTRNDDTKGQRSGAKGTGAASKAKSDAKGKPNDPGPAVERAKADAKAAGGKARKEAGSVADEAAKAASDVTDKAKRAASDVAETARSELRGALDEQKAAGADRAQRIADAIERAGDELGKEIPVLGDAMQRAAQEIEGIAEAVRNREPRELLDVAQGFARRQPALFAGAVGLAGFAAVRFLMASPRSGAGTGMSAATAGSGADRTGSPSIPSTVPDRDTPATGDPGGVSPVAPGFGPADADVKGGT